MTNLKIPGVFSENHIPNPPSLDFSEQQAPNSISMSVHGCSNHSNLEIEAEFLTKNLSYLNLNISRTKNGRNKL